MTKPKIALYTVCKDEVELLPHFLDYHEDIVDHIYFFDNNSTDGTRELLQSKDWITIIDYDTKDVLRDDLHMIIKNSCWQEHKDLYDWVIVTDLDEFLYHKNLFEYLNKSKEKGFTILRTCGFNMIDDAYPKQGISIIDQVKLGAYSTNFSKSIVFDPQEILQINFSPGGHFIEPVGNIKLRDSNGLLLLHYKYLGGLTRLRQRWNLVGEKLSKINLDYRWGIKRMYPDIIEKRYNYVKNNSRNVTLLDMI